MKPVYIGTLSGHAHGIAGIAGIDSVDRLLVVWLLPWNEARYFTEMWRTLGASDRRHR